MIYSSFTDKSGWTGFGKLIDKGTSYVSLHNGVKIKSLFNAQEAMIVSPS